MWRHTTECWYSVITKVLGQPSRLLFYNNHYYTTARPFESSPSNIACFIICFTFGNHYQQEYIYNLRYNHSPISIKKREESCKNNHACLLFFIRMTLRQCYLLFPILPIFASTQFCWSQWRIYRVGTLLACTDISS